MCVLILMKGNVKELELHLIMKNNKPINNSKRTLFRNMKELYKVSQRQILYDITYMWSLKRKIQMNLLTKQKETHRYRKQT